MSELTTRRKWVYGGLLGGGAAGVAVALKLPLFGHGSPSHSFPSGQLLGTIPFEDENNVPLGAPAGQELDGRQYLDLSQLGPSNLTTPANLFYIRTRVSHLLRAGPDWTIRVTGIGKPVQVGLKQLHALATPQGVRLLECAGNTRSASFGLISAASWDGVLISELLDRWRAPASGRVLVSGFDSYSARPKSPSTPGASWIFAGQELKSVGAFLALRLDGQPLTPDHGAPVRLVVPGWYGCAAIKWVNEISIVPDDVQATAQMKEYASRTHQDGEPALARDYHPATIETAALPVRIERWLVSGRIQYKVIGIVWGGTRPVKALRIRFRPEDPDQPVQQVHWAADRPWGMWEQPWQPESPGIYRIRLRLEDQSVPARRLNEGFYVRTVRVTQI